MRQNLPTIEEVLKYWLFEEHLYDMDGFSIDWAEPECWVCGEHWNGRYDVKNSRADRKTIVTHWKKAPLARCHILPDHLNGNSDSSNIFLLCDECHELAPDTTYREIFFEWAKKQSKYTRTCNEIKELLKIFNISGSHDIAFLTEIFSRIPQHVNGKLSYKRNTIQKEFEQFLEKHCGVHWSSRLGKGAKIKMSTYIGLAVQFMREKQQTQLLLF